MAVKPGLPDWRGVVFVLLGFTGVWVGLQAAEFRLFGVAVAMFSFFLASSFLGKAGRLAAVLRPLVGRTVRVEIWGVPPSGAGDALFDINAITGFGADLLLHLLPEAGGPGSVLKVAQPGSERLEDDLVEIATAAYVQWAGRKIERPPGTTAPALTLSVP